MTFGRFRVLEKIGQGGMSTVWRARDELLGRDIALKVLAEHLATSQRARQRFVREARNTAELNHPGILQVLDANEDARHAWIALQLVDGETLSERIARAPMAIPEVVRIASAAADALQHAHTHGLMHRDLNSRNIMIGRDGRVFVVDFGLSRALSDDPLTSTGTLMGTVACVSPEVARMQPATTQSDVYGLGLVTFEMLTRRLPYLGDRAEALLYSIVHEPVPSPSGLRPDCPPALEHAILHAMEKDSARRTASAAAFKSELTLPAADAATENVARNGGAATTPTRATPVAHVSTLYVAILPFDVLCLEPEHSDDAARLARHLTDTLASALARMPELRVVEDWDLSRFAGASLEEMARQVGANRLVGGSLLRSGSQVRASCWVADPFAAGRLTSDSIDGSITDLLAFEDEVLARVTTALGAETAPTREIPPFDPAAEERYRTALSYLERHDRPAMLDGAVRLLEQLVARYPDRGDICATLSRALLIQHRTEPKRSLLAAATRLSESAETLSPDAPETLLALGELRLTTGPFEDARAAFQKSFDRSPSAEALIGLGRACELLGDVAAAESALRRAIALQGDGWSGYNWLGLALLHAGRHADALQAFEAAFERSRDNPRVLGNMAAAHFNLGRLDDAIAAAQRSIALQPSARALSNLGGALYFSGRLDEAVEAYEKAVALEPHDPQLHANLGSVARQIKGREAQARAALEHAVLLYRDHLHARPQDAVAWARLAGTLGNLHRFDEAAKAVEQALAIGPRTLSVVSQAIGAYATADPDRALELVKEALQLGASASSIRRDPALATLRNNPNFEGVVPPA